MSESTAALVCKCENWIRIAIALQICVKPALLAILHDTKNGLTRDQTKLYKILCNFKSKLEKETTDEYGNPVDHKKRLFNSLPWDKLCHPDKTKTDSKDLDISCIVALIINLTKFTGPKGGWFNPSRKDNSMSANVIKARELRNKINHCAVEEIKEKQQFEDYWKNVNDILVKLKFSDIELFNELATVSLDSKLPEQMLALRDLHGNMQESIKGVEDEMESMKKRIKATENTTKEHDKRIQNLEEKDNQSEKLRLNTADFKKCTKEKYGKIFREYEKHPVEKKRDDVIIDLKIEIKEEDQKKKFSYKDIKTSRKDYVIIEGCAGMGKTTLAETLAYQWASDNLLNEFDRVFVLKFSELSKLKDNDAITAKQILSEFYPNHSFDPSKKNLIIIDGIDEFVNTDDFKNLPKGNNEEDEELTGYAGAVSDLLSPHNSKLPFARIVTTRPSGVSELLDLLKKKKSKPTTILHLYGFDDDLINENIEQQSIVPEKLETYQIKDMMKVPFFCSAACYFLQKEDSGDPTSKTGLYCNLFALFFRNHVLRNPNLSFPDGVLDDPETKQIVLELANVFHARASKTVITTMDYGEEVGDPVKKTGMTQKNAKLHCEFMKHYFFKFLLALHTFHVASIESLFDPQIQSIVAGLIGGNLDGSKSEWIVQRYAKLFHNEDGASINLTNLLFQKCTNSLLDYEAMIDQERMVDKTHLINILCEYRNKVEMDEKIVVGSYRDSKIENDHQIKYFQSNHGSVNIGNIHCRVDFMEIKGIDNETKFVWFFDPNELAILTLISNYVSLEVVGTQPLHTEESDQKSWTEGCSSFSTLNDIAEIHPDLWFDRIIVADSQQRCIAELVNYTSNLDFISPKELKSLPTYDVILPEHDIHITYHLHIDHLDDEETSKFTKELLIFFCQKVTTTTLAIYREKNTHCWLSEDHKHCCCCLIDSARAKSLLERAKLNNVENLKIVLSCIGGYRYGKPPLLSDCLTF